MYDFFFSLAIWHLLFTQFSLPLPGRFSEVNSQECITPEVPPPGIGISFRVEEGGGANDSECCGPADLGERAAAHQVNGRGSNPRRASAGQAK